MFCPTCSAEYREGITQCAHCEVSLVDQPPGDDPYATPASMAAVLEGKDIAPLMAGHQEALSRTQAILAQGKVASVIGEVPQGMARASAENYCLYIAPEQAEAARELLQGSWQSQVELEGLEPVATDSATSDCPACGAEVADDQEECPDCGLYVGPG